MNDIDSTSFKHRHLSRKDENVGLHIILYCIFQEADPIPDKYDIVVQVKACSLSRPNTKVSCMYGQHVWLLYEIWLQENKLVKIKESELMQFIFMY